MRKNKLHNINSTGFKIPNDYFDSFEENLFERLDEKDALKGIETSGFSVPTDYFDLVESNVLKKLQITSKTPVITLKSRRTFFYVAGFAASFALLFSLVFTEPNNLSIHTLDTVSIESYLYQEDYSNEDLASLFKSDEISETDFIDLNISEDTLNDYLDNLDTEDLILE